MELLIASNNKHKIEEIKAVLNGKFDKITSLAEDGIVCDPEEIGETFYQNALIKAQAVAKLCNKEVLADDTGLCVNALHGRPGVHSARYANDHDNAANRRKVLAELQGATDRSAYFQSVVVLLYPDGKVVTGEGKVEGYILEQEQGAHGFGYDSIFYSTELNKTFAEASMGEKLSVSHRSRALHDLLSKLK
ncbi:MAG: RdgB/HAM1 family non-canonical purine NTP pyrophosphatase [Clostridiales bacterium]|nr:RdgB/HAM1 family non-canonical purine NTP pyrophosphatase [Clostridiales bacterium]